MTNTLEFDQLQSLLKNGDLSFFNIYGSDIDISINSTTQYYLDNPSDNIDKDQTLSVYYLDIELLVDELKALDVKEADSQINSITRFFSGDNRYITYFLVKPENSLSLGYDEAGLTVEKINALAKYYTEKLIESKHIIPEESIELQFFTTEEELLIAYLKDIRECDPCILTGFYSDKFDNPYVYYRCCALFGKQRTEEMMSRFGIVTERNGIISIPEFIQCDLRYLYTPRDEGGLNFGKRLFSYSLDSVSDSELGLKKFEYKDSGMNLNDFYLKDPVHFLLYNIVDVALTVRLNEKLKHIDLFNTLRRMNKAPFSRSLVGSSIFYDSFITYKMKEEGKVIRHGIVSEKEKMFKKESLTHIIAPKMKKTGSIPPSDISSSEYSSIAAKFDGAYVKKSVSKIINDGSLIIDLDASSLYPSMMLQHNISFDTFRAKIISPLTYKFIDLLESLMGTNKLPERVFTSIFELVCGFIDRTDLTPKGTYRKHYYYTICKLFMTLISSGYKLDEILEGNTNATRALLIHYFIPLTDILYTIHPEKEAYNTFIYAYLFGKPEDLVKKVPYTYTIINMNSTKKTVVKMNTAQTLEFMKQYNSSITGCLFDKHEVKLGVFTNLLLDLKRMRKEYNDKLHNCDEGTKEWQLNNSRQLGVKISMNSIYGVSGLRTFKYSDFNIAHTITSSGRLSIKVASQLTEDYLIANYSN